jgi:hypothetical protein
MAWLLTSQVQISLSAPPVARGPSPVGLSRSLAAPLPPPQESESVRSAPIFSLTGGMLPPRETGLFPSFSSSWNWRISSSLGISPARFVFFLANPVRRPRSLGLPAARRSVMAQDDPVVSAQWLHEHLGMPDVKVKKKHLVCVFIFTSETLQ